jgi:signal transduction histidine kinase/CheY-like chemotaxis protein
MKFPVFVISLSALIVFIYYPVAGQVEEDITVNPQNNNSYLTTANFFGMKSFITENRFYKGNGLNTLVEKLSANQNPVNKTDSSALALLVFQIGYAEYLEGNNSSANYYYKKAGSLLNSETDDTLITHLYRFRSLLYLGELNFDSSRYYSNRGLTFCKRKNLVAASERFNALLAIADETERSYKLATTDKNHLFPTELILDNQRAVNKTDLIIHNAFYLKHFKEQQALQLEIEKKNSKAKRNLVFFYFLSIAGITFTAAVIFYLRSERNKSLLKKEKESEHLMSRFFVNLSHELRTPITLILGPLEILLSNARSEERKLLNVVQKNGQKMLRLVNHLLDISKIEAGKMEFKASRNDIIPLLSSLYSSFHLYALSKNIKLNYQSKFDKYKLYFNMDMMEKIISNLLSNALKFTSENGSVTLSIKDEWISTTRYLAIEIIDTGMGIQKKDLPKLFNRYYQVGKYKQNTWEGTGIGLSLAKELVELHSGKIEVKSEMCVGTSFKILLPTGKNHLNEDNIYEIEQEYEDKELPIELMDSIVNEEPAQPIDKAKHLVLVIDDNSDMRRYLRQVLSKEYHVIDAPNGKSGIEKVFEYTPDLIVCDLMMPVTDGNQVCERLKADEQTKHIPIIILTAKNNDDDRLTSLQKKSR